MTLSSGPGVVALSFVDPAAGATRLVSLSAVMMLGAPLRNAGPNFRGAISGHMKLSDCRSALKLLIPSHEQRRRYKRSKLSYPSLPKLDTSAYLCKHAEVPRELFFWFGKSKYQLPSVPDIHTGILGL